MKIRNISTGPRGAYNAGKLVMAERGETIEADDYAAEWFSADESEDGFRMTHVGAGWYEITGPGLDEPIKERGEEAASKALAEIREIAEG